MCAGQEAAEWLEYMTTDRPSALGQERAASGGTLLLSLPPKPVTVVQLRP